MLPSLKRGSVFAKPAPAGGAGAPQNAQETGLQPWLELADALALVDGTSKRSSLTARDKAKPSGSGQGAASGSQTERLAKAGGQVGKVLKKKKSVSNLADPKMESPRTRKVKATGTKTPSALPLVPPLSMRTPTKPSEGKAGAGAARSAEALVASPLPAAAKSTPGAGRAAGASSNPSGGAGGAGRPSVSFSITVDRPDAASTAKELGIDFDLDSFNRKRAKRSVAETELEQAERKMQEFLDEKKKAEEAVQAKKQRKKKRKAAKAKERRRLEEEKLRLEEEEKTKKAERAKLVAESKRKHQEKKKREQFAKELADKAAQNERKAIEERKSRLADDVKDKRAKMVKLQALAALRADAEAADAEAAVGDGAAPAGAAAEGQQPGQSGTVVSKAGAGAAAQAAASSSASKPSPAASAGPAGTPQRSSAGVQLPSLPTPRSGQTTGASPGGLLRQLSRSDKAQPSQPLPPAVGALDAALMGKLSSLSSTIPALAMHQQQQQQQQLQPAASESGSLSGWRPTELGKISEGARGAQPPSSQAQAQAAPPPAAVQQQPFSAVALLRLASMPSLHAATSDRDRDRSHSSRRPPLFHSPSMPFPGSGSGHSARGPPAESADTSADLSLSDSPDRSAAALRLAAPNNRRATMGATPVTAAAIAAALAAAQAKSQPKREVSADERLEQRRREIAALRDSLPRFLDASAIVYHAPEVAPDPAAVRGARYQPHWQQSPAAVAQAERKQQAKQRRQRRSSSLELSGGQLDKLRTMIAATSASAAGAGAGGSGSEGPTSPRGQRLSTMSVASSAASPSAAASSGGGAGGSGGALASVVASLVRSGSTRTIGLVQPASESLAATAPDSSEAAAAGAGAGAGDSAAGAARPARLGSARSRLPQEGASSGPISSLTRKIDKLRLTGILKH